MRICVFEDAGVARLGPLAQTRPAYELRCGALSLLERQMRHFGAREASAFVRPELAALCREARPGLPVNEPAKWGGPVVAVNARWLPPAEGFAADGPALGLIDDEVAYAVLPPDAGGLTDDTLHWHVSGWRNTLPARPAGGALLEYPWDVVERNGEALEQDWGHWRAARESAGRPEGVAVVGPPERFLADPAAKVEPLVVVDTTKGPVLIDAGALVQAFSRLEGPCYVGPGTHVLSARVRGSSFGPECRIGGEVEASVVHGHSNKAHDGFLGHSYVGEWVNLGAGTQTSDLRNDYGPVSVTVAGQKVETGRMKVGSFLGDHTKTSIGTLFNTGSVVGAFGQLVASGGLMPRSLPAFCQVSQGRVQERSDLRAVFETAATVMARRGRAWTEAHAEFYLDLYERTAREREKMVRDSEQRPLRRVV